MNISIHAPPRGATGLHCVCVGYSIFQFTPLREGRQSRRLAYPTWIYFNSRPSARGDLSCKFSKVLARNFNSRPSARGDFPLHSFTVDLLYFNSRPSARGDVPGNSACASALDFNSRPSARGDGGFGQGDAIEAISIHAPPRGATANVQPLLLGDKFQFTPLREGRLIPKEKWQFGRDFNSRPSARGDGAFQATTGCTPYFNSRPSARGDVKTRFDCADSWTFQFTPLREGRRSSRHPHVASVFDFNSRPSARGDAGCITVVAVNSNFNSRPSARGDSCVFSILLFIFVKFQFTPLREGRPQGVTFRSLTLNFNSRPSARGDVKRSQPLVMYITFQFTPLREGRQYGATGCERQVAISIHAPPRGATRLLTRKTPRLTDFNSRPSARGDPKRLKIQASSIPFQFTPLREGRRRFGADEALMV